MLRGKIEIQNRVPAEGIFEKEDGLINLIYTPGVAYVAKEISRDKKLAYEYTSKWNNVAIICDGTRVLGLGNIGPEGALPVMEGKSVLMKLLGGINAIPLCIATQDKEEIIKFVKYIEPMFGAINIEDIESPKVLDIVERLKKEISLPVFHDDQHGTAIITLSALLNALTLLDKKLTNTHVVILGAGSAGYGITKILFKAGCKNMIVIDSQGSIYKGREDLATNPYKRDIAFQTNPNEIRQDLVSALKEADVFIGVSGQSNIVTSEMVRSMNQNPIIFALSNPDPEILPHEAKKGGARIIATGRTDFANQINNATIFPSLIRSLLDLQIKVLSEELLVTVAKAIAGLVDKKHLKDDYIIPQINDQRILPIVTQTIKKMLKSHLVT
ncbi:MAG: NADP-dependent malic enzyme [Nitrososphaeraceae archaeon]|nr:NADP-dependent malic enzyme [Nitrososphaeraceae archaeon]